MIGRDRIVVRWKNTDGDPVEKVLYGVVVTEQLDGKLEPFGSSLVFTNYYRLIFPRSLNLTGASSITVSFRNRTNVRLETPNRARLRRPRPGAALRGRGSVELTGMAAEVARNLHAMVRNRV